MKLTDLHYISDRNHYDFKLCQKVIILKKKNSAHKLLLGPVQILERQCSYIIIKTYESTESIDKQVNFITIFYYKTDIVLNTSFIAVAFCELRLIIRYILAISEIFLFFLFEYFQPVSLQLFSAVRSVQY